jgi:hypothetical protein
VSSDPQLAGSIRELLHQYGRGMAYLATVRKDGAPRVHPVSPIVTADALYCFVIASRKRDDLLRDGRYALHTFPAESSDAEAHLTGIAREVLNVSIVDQLAREHRAAPGIDWTLFELLLDSAMLHRHTPDAAPHIWRACHPSTATPEQVLVAA